MASEILNQILEKTRIEDVIAEHIDLHKKGKNLWAICPFHEDSNPSMSVSPDKQIFKCFVCGEGGNVINFLTNFKKVNYGEVIKELANKLDIDYNYVNKDAIKYTDEQQKLINAIKDATEYFQYCLLTGEGKDALNYLEKRNISDEIREKFKIGYCPKNGVVKFLLSKGHDEATLINASIQNERGNSFFSNKLIFPISNKQGDVVGFSGRTLIKDFDGPKYINSKESLIFKKSAIFYNYYNASATIKKSKEIIITEGFFDVIAMWESGINNTVAVMGTALTKQHLNLIKDNKVTLMLDSDKAGIKASLKSLTLLLSNQIESSVIYNNTGKDPDEIYQENKKALKNLVSNKFGALKFIYAILKKQYQPEEPTSIKLFVSEFNKYLKFGTILDKDFYGMKMSKEFNISLEAIKSLMPNIKIHHVDLDIKTIPLEEKFNDNGKNNISYKIIVSMVKNKSLIKIYEDTKSFFSDMVLTEIGKYIIAKNSNENPLPLSNKAMAKLQIIQDAKPGYESSEDSFRELLELNRIKNKSDDYSKLRVQLKKATSNHKEDIEIDILEKMRVSKGKGRGK